MGVLTFNIDINKELEYYEISQKLNDYIGVQKNVISKLEVENYFREVTNLETGMVICLTKKGVKETLGSGKRFQNLPRIIKALKIVTVHILPDIIQSAHLIKNDVSNIHGKNSFFAYFEINIKINGVRLRITFDVKKNIEKNKFWIHYIDIKKENSQLLSLGQSQAINEIRNLSGNSLS